MFTRIVEFTLKRDKVDDFRRILTRDIHPVLKQQAGFVDVVGLVSESDPYTVISITFWHTKNEAERYGAEQYPRFIDMVRPFLQAAPIIRSFTVQDSTFYKIAAGKAA
ncbi:MAG TPA: antibiotic biosynthesis monooxygenase [Terriglobales bacterium]|nr:antibiotic biosynthesis monooxygenase [Terriglobales bacterium]